MSVDIYEATSKVAPLKLGAAVQGSLQTYILNWLRADGTARDLTGATITGTFARDGSVYEVTGTLTVSDGPNGQFTWELSEEDVGAPGSYRLFFTAVIDGVPYVTLPIEWRVLANPAANAVAPPALIGITPATNAWLTAERTAVGTIAVGEIPVGDGDNLQGSGYLAATSLRRNNYTAVTAPTANDDAADGYMPGSVWVDVTNDKAYVCVDASVGTAVWTETTQSGGSGAVDSVFGRTGAVVAASGDYNAGQVTNTPAGSIAAVTVQNAINELDTEKQPLDTLLTALAALVTAADKLAYFTGSDTVTLADLTAFARTLLDDADAATARTTLGLVAAGTGGIWVEKAGDTMTGELVMGDQLLTRSLLKDTAEAVNALGNVSGTMTIDYESGHYVTATLTGAVTTLTINNWPGTGRLGSFTLELTPAGNTVSWTGVTWVGDAPTLGSTVDFIVLWTRDGGSTIYAAHVGATA